MPAPVERLAESVVEEHGDGRERATWPCRIRLPEPTVRCMSLYVWEQPLAPDFPLAVLVYESRAERDRMHWHEYLEIALILDGRGTFQFGRRPIPAETGDIFFIDNSQPHVAVADAGTELRLLLVLFRPELIARPGCWALDAGYLAPFNPGGGPDSARIRGGSALAAELSPVLHELLATWGDQDPDHRYLADATLRRVLGLVNRHRGVCAAAAARSDRADQIRPVLAFVEDHCRDSITLEDVAEVVHVSPSRVRHLFKDVTGVSFKEYVTHVRVAESKRLLLETDLSVAEVARQVSYTNLHQFYKVFNRSCSISPGEYRRYYTQSTTGGHRPVPLRGRDPQAGSGAEERLPSVARARSVDRRTEPGRA